RRAHRSRSASSERNAAHAYARQSPCFRASNARRSSFGCTTRCHTRRSPTSSAARLAPSKRISFTRWATSRSGLAKRLNNSMHLGPHEFIDLAEGVRAEIDAPHLLACPACRRQLADVRAPLSE